MSERTKGKRKLAMPDTRIMSQLSDMIGVRRQTAVPAFRFGDGLSNIFWPTADIVIICGLGGIKLQKWYRFFTPLFAMLLIAQMILLGLAVAIGYSGSVAKGSPTGKVGVEDQGRIKTPVFGALVVLKAKPVSAQIA